MESAGTEKAVQEPFGMTQGIDTIATRTRRDRPIISPAELPEWLARGKHPAVIAAVGAAGARELIRAQLEDLDLVEGQDWWAAA